MATITPPDELNVTGGGAGVTIIDNLTLEGEVGQAVDDTYVGTITYQFNLEWTELANGTGASGFGALQLYQGGGERMGIGVSWTNTNWGCYQIPGTGDANLLDNTMSTVPLATGTPEPFLVVIEYVAGGDDTCTITFRGNDNVFVGDFSFTEVRVRSGNTGQTANFTGISLTANQDDLDNDGLPDAWEQQIIAAAAAEDPPQTLTLADIKGPNDDPQTSDYDMDGSPDHEEYDLGTSPINPDTDGDGLNDGDEQTNGTNPQLADTDGDCLDDGLEINTHATDPLSPDSDGGGTLDGIEVLLGTNPAVGNEADDLSTNGDLDLVGTEDFTYADGPLAGQAGGAGWDYDNNVEPLTLEEGFAGHSTKFSQWLAMQGDPQVSGGKLLTLDSSIARAFHGGSQALDAVVGEISGYFREDSLGDGLNNRDVLYLKYEMTRRPGATWGGASLFEYGNEQIFMGVISTPNPGSGQREFGLVDRGTNPLTEVYTNVAAIDDETSVVVVKLDFAASTASMWINPDLGTGEGANAPQIDQFFMSFDAMFGTRVRLGSGGTAGAGETEWDGLKVGTTWDAIADGASPGPLELCVNSLNATTGELSLSVTNIPDGQFHLRQSTDLMNFLPMDPPVDFDSTTTQPLLIDVSEEPETLFYRVFSGPTPQP